MKWWLTSVAFVMLCVASARADELLHRQPPGRTFGYPSDTLLLDDFNRPSGQLVADRFSLSGESLICRTSVYAFFGGTGVVDPGPPPAEVLRVRFFGDVAGLPDGQWLYEAILVDPARVWTGELINIAGARKEYLYQLPLPSCFMAESDTAYWLEVAQLGDLTSYFRWEGSNTVGEFAVQYPLGTPYRLVTGIGQLAYELWTPEPCSGALLGLGFAYRLLRRAR